MRRVLRESLYLLLAGQMAALVQGRSPQEEFLLGYEDFSVLRPEIGESSWRGAMAKAKQRKWVVSRSVDGSTKFQLTRYGRESIGADFMAFQRFKEAGSLWTLLVLQPLEGKRQQYAALKRELEGMGAALVIPSLYAWPGEIYSSDLVRRLEDFGFLPCFFPVDAKKARPTQLDIFWRTSSVYQQKIRSLEAVSRKIEALLNKISSKKNIHHQQKSQIGSLIITGMATLSQFQWFEVDQHRFEHQILPCAENIDALAGLHISTSGEENT